MVGMILTSCFKYTYGGMILTSFTYGYDINYIPMVGMILTSCFIYN